jgi:hypothetical protein
MCLVVKWKDRIGKGITVYKVQQLMPGTNDKLTFKSAFREHEPEYNKVIKDDAVMEKEIENLKKGDVVGAGCFHFYTTIEEAEKTAENISIHYRTTRIIECKLRKGSLVIRGCYNDIACKKAKFTEKVIGVYENGILIPT